MHPGDGTRRAPTTRGPAAGLAEERLKSKVCLTWWMRLSLHEVA